MLLGEGEKGSGEPPVLARSESCLTSVMQLVDNFIWQLDWNFWIRLLCNERCKEEIQVYSVKFSEAN